MDIIDKIWEEKWLKLVKNSIYGTSTNTFTLWGTLKRRNELRREKIESIWKNKLKD